MPNPIVGALVSVGSGAIGGAINAYFGYRASKDQQMAAQTGINEVQNRYTDFQNSMQPYATAGGSALNSQLALAGLGAPGSEQAQIDAIKNSPEFQSMLKTGETSILQNASATGGLRGGNTQAALATYSPQLLSQLVNERYSRLSGISSMGYGASSNIGAAGLSTGQLIAQLLADKGAAKAGGTMAIGQGISGLFGSAAQGLGTYYGMGGRFGSQSTTPIPQSAIQNATALGSGMAIG